MTTIPNSVRAVLEGPALAHLVTLEPDGRPQVSIVWVGLAGDEIVTAGGRVLNVTGLGADLTEARAAAYAAADMIEFDGRQLRRDIALREVRA